MVDTWGRPPKILERLSYKDPRRGGGHRNKSIPPSISIIYRRRDRFLSVGDLLTAALDPAADRTCSACKSNPGRLDPLTVAGVGAPERTCSACKSNPGRLDPLTLAGVGEPERACPACKSHRGRLDPLTVAGARGAQAHRPSCDRREHEGLRFSKRVLSETGFRIARSQTLASRCASQLGVRLAVHGSTVVWGGFGLHHGYGGGTPERR